jgi:hypothetical protein
MRRKSEAKSSTLSAWLPATALLASSWLAVAGIALRPADDADIAAVAFPPWWTAGRAMAAAAEAEAAIVRSTAVPSLLVVRVGDANGMARLRRAGAWFSIDPQAVGGCFTFNGGSS